MPSHQYDGLEVIQQPGAPPFYMSSAPAAEILEWCDVPRAKGDYMAGYQRLLDANRTGDLAKYLRLSPNNIVPGAVIVAVDSDYVTLEAQAQNVYRITIREDRRTFEEKLQELWGAFTTRLADEELESAAIDFSVEGANETTSAEVNDPIAESEMPPPGESAGDGEGEDAIEADLAEAGLGDGEDDDAEDEDAFPSSYLASLAKELTAAVEDWDSVPVQRQGAIRAFIEGVSKPGLIIDGQHRVFGAKDVSEHDVVLPVVLLPGLAFSEQVFQFYVLNSKARPLKPTELRRIVSTSLTNAEIAELYQRFKAAGVEAEEARWTLEVNRRPNSPFRGLIDFGYSETGAVIPENVADQVVRGFMKMPMRRYRQLITPLGDAWSDSDSRLEIFFWFWGAVKNVYSDAWSEAEQEAAEGRKAQLFMKVSLLTLQRFLLDRFVTALPYRGASEGPPLSAQEEVASMVKSTLTNLPSEFFRREWKMKQIDTSEGRKALYAAMETVWNNQGKMHGNMALFRG